LKRLGAAAVIFDDDGHVLLVKHSYGRLNWELAGGAAEPDESIVETALGEVREETGLDVEAEYTSDVYYEPAEDFLHFVFVCHRLDPQAQPRPNLAEISVCGFWPIDELPRPISTFTIRRVRDALAGDGWPLPAIVPHREWLE